MERSERPRTPIVRLILLAMLGTIALVVGPSVRASAATDSFYVFMAGSPTNHVGELSTQLRVPAQSAPITAVTPHLIAPSTQTDTFDPALTQTALTTISGGYTVTTWSVPSPITETQLPLGSYTIALDVTFQDGVTQVASDAGTLNFMNVAQVTMTADHIDVGYDYSPVINISGTVQIVAPDGTVTPYANSALTLTTAASPPIASQPLTTDAGGGFTAQLTTRAIAWAQVTLTGVTNVINTGNTIVFTEVVDPIKLTAWLSSAKVTAGARDTVQGKLSYLPKDTGSTYLPLPTRQVYLFAPNSGSILPIATADTDAHGSYHLAVPAAYQTQSWTVEAGKLVGDSQFGPAQLNVLEKVEVPTQVTKFSIHLSQYWGLTFSGCLNLARNTPSPGIPNTAGLVLQYSSGGQNGPWHTLVKSIPQSNTCGIRGLWFDWRATAPLNWAYYRAYYTGYHDPYSGTGYLPASSAKVLAWKYADRIANFSVSPTVVSNSGDITVKGQLQYYANYAWRDYGGQSVYIIFRQQGSSAWYWIVKVTTNSSGHFAAVVPVAGIGNATWSAQFNGNSTHLATAPAGVYVRVTG
jgi:hypothetical protein